MKVKIRDKIYNAEDEPIMLILSDADKELISNMAPDNYKYCVYPDEKMTEDEVREWMQTPDLDEALNFLTELMDGELEG